MTRYIDLGTKTSIKLLEEVSDFIVNNETQNWIESYATMQRNRLAIDIDLIKENNIQQEHSILECGCAPFLLTAAMTSLGYNIRGLDLYPEHFAKTISHFNLAVSKCDFEVEKIPFDDEFFDVVIFNEVFEHLRINPIFTMSEVLRVLKKGGILFLSTPNLKSILGIYNFLFRDQAHSCMGGIYSQYKFLETVGCTGHVREYTEREVSDFLNSIGFTKLDCIYRGPNRTRTSQILMKLLHPKLRTFFTIIATKK